MTELRACSTETLCHKDKQRELTKVAGCSEEPRHFERRTCVMQIQIPGWGGKWAKLKHLSPHGALQWDRERLFQGIRSLLVQFTFHFAGFTFGFYLIMTNIPWVLKSLLEDSRIRYLGWSRKFHIYMRGGVQPRSQSCLKGGSKIKGGTPKISANLLFIRGMVNHTS